MKLIKIAMYLGENDGPTVDATNIEYGNPGVGGTQFCMLQLAHFIKPLKKYDVTLFSNRSYQLEEGIHFEYCRKYEDLIPMCEQKKIEILLLNNFNNSKLREHILNTNIRLIAWCHNYLYADQASYLSHTNQIKAVVFVGKQMYDRYIDHDIIRKSTFIHNMFYDSIYHIIRDTKNKNVVYMGSIVPGKGFKELCSIWPGIIERIPDARLIVLGNGKLYGNAQLGVYGIAEDAYEKTFIKYITDTTGNIIPSVIFKGIVGSNKIEIFKSAAVGVVNPSGRTETFGMGIVEMAQAKLPVVTIGRNGHFDTVIDGCTGILGKNLKAVQKGIIDLLEDTGRNIRLGETAKKFIQIFAPNMIIEKWDSIISDVFNNTLKINYIRPSKPFGNNQKWLRCIIRLLRFDLGLKFIPSLITIETNISKLLR